MPAMGWEWSLESDAGGYVMRNRRASQPGILSTGELCNNSRVTLALIPASLPQRGRKGSGSDALMRRVFQYHVTPDFELDADWLAGQYQAMRPGKDGICGSRGNVESASCRLQRTIQKINPIANNSIFIS